MVRHILLALAGAIALAGCDAKPPAGLDGTPAPALWEITSEDGAQGWLFGTIHTLPGGVEWHNEVLNSAIAGSDTLAVEVADFSNESGADAIYEQLALAATAQPLLADRVAPSQRANLIAIMDEAGFDQGHFTQMDTWAASFYISGTSDTGSSDNGVDRDLVDNYMGGPIVELEGTKGQLSVFDRLAEEDQRQFLSSVVERVTDGRDDPLRFARIWYNGDMETLVKEAQRGFLGDPEIRAAVLVRRNRNWTAKVDKLLKSGAKPLVAVGAGHIPGPDGMVEMLETLGYTVTRIQ